MKKSLLSFSCPSSPFSAFPGSYACIAEKHDGVKGKDRRTCGKQAPHLKQTAKSNCLEDGSAQPSQSLYGRMLATSCPACAGAVGAAGGAVGAGGAAGGAAGVAVGAWRERRRSRAFAGRTRKFYAACSACSPNGKNN